MRITLNLRNYCIETAIKKLYNQSISTYFKNKASDKHLERQIENLKEVLETLDFGTLRIKFPVLAGHHEDDVALSFDKKNNVSILINGKPIKWE
jgi:hypothetical protein